MAAKMGNFAHNTGEGSMSSYHEKVVEILSGKYQLDTLGERYKEIFHQKICIKSKKSTDKND